MCLKIFCGKVNVNEMEFDFMPEKGKIDDVFILRRLQEEYIAKIEKLYVLCGHRETLTGYQGKCWNGQ